MAALGPGLYLHVPYCRSICPYCDFNVYRTPQRPPFEGLAKDMLLEMAARAHAFVGPLTSIYFGGGTPSLMPAHLVARLIGAARQLWGLADPCEITLEADPGTIDGPGLRALRQVGVNRLSIGWQSSHDTLLRTLGRPHAAQAGEQAVALARAAGFTTISLDLIFAVPGQTLAHLEQDLDALLALNPEHVSLYALTYHAGTPMARRLQRGSIASAPEALELAMMERIHARLTGAGFGHYETSNFARPHAQSRHNSLYWAYESYLGIGPGAHSFFAPEGTGACVRWCNLKSPARYSQAMGRLAAPGQAPHLETPPNAGAGPLEVDFVELLTPAQQLLERMMVGLRLERGVALPAVRALLQDSAQAERFEAAVASTVRRGWAEALGDRLVPTALGRTLTDSAAALFVL